MEQENDVKTETPDVPGTLTGARKQVMAEILLAEKHLADAKTALLSDEPDEGYVRDAVNLAIRGSSKRFTALRQATKKLGAREPKS